VYREQQAKRFNELSPSAAINNSFDPKVTL
jgi:hypothetical protein